LQPDLPGHRLVNELADARDLTVKCIESIQGIAPIRRREQRGEIAVAVGLAHERGAVGEVGLHDSQWSCPALCRASTPFSLKKQDVDGRVKPGHDAELNRPR
jgi:hypothetical protein